MREWIEDVTGAIMLFAFCWSLFIWGPVLSMHING